jgi:hypothetical protein
MMLRLRTRSLPGTRSDCVVKTQSTRKTPAHPSGLERRADRNPRHAWTVRNQSRRGRPVCEVGAYRLGTDSLKEGFVFESLRLRRDRHVALVID